MDLLQEKRNLNVFINNIIKKLKFKNYKINLIGTASLQNLLYFSDYDFNSIIKKKYNSLSIYKELIKIFNNTFEDFYFIELKITYNDDSTLKIYDKNKINKSMFKNVKKIKVDYVLFYYYHFKELSIMYIFNNDTNDIIEKLKEDYMTFIKEKNYFKALKRLFSIYKITKKNKEAVELLKYFNSDYGALYQTNSNLKTLLLLKGLPRNRVSQPELSRLIDINLKYLNLNPNINIEKEIKQNNKILNEDSKKYLI